MRYIKTIKLILNDYEINFIIKKGVKAMRNFQKLMSVIFSLSIIFTMCTSNLRTFSFTRDLSRYLDNGINGLTYECKDENNFTHFCNDEDLTYEKISNMTFDEFKAKYTSPNYDMDRLYAISKLKSGEKHVTIHDGNVHNEYFRVNAVDEILDFFKTKFNYEKKDYKKDSYECMAKYGIIGGVIGGIYAYICSSLFDKTQGSKKIESKNEPKQKNVTEKNKQPLSQKLKIIICSAIGSVVGGAVGVLLDRESNVWNLRELNFNYYNAKRNASGAFNKKSNSYLTEDWTDNDVLKLHMNLDYPEGHSPNYEYYNVGIGYSDDEQKTINEEYETLGERVTEAIFPDEVKKLLEKIEQSRFNKDIQKIDN